MRSLLLSAMVLGTFGCQTTDVRTNDGRALPPAPSAIPPPPAGITIDAMTLLVGQRPIDVDGDGYPDRIEAAVALFSEDYDAASLRVPGNFVFVTCGRGRRFGPSSSCLTNLADFDSQPLSMRVFPNPPMLPKALTCMMPASGLHRL